MKLMQILVAAGFVLCAVAVVGSGSAAADPSGCTTSVQLIDASASCSGGDGMFEVRAKCFGLYSNGYSGGVPAFGNYTSPQSNIADIGGRAVASCNSFAIPTGIANGVELTCFHVDHPGSRFWSGAGVCRP